MCTRKSQASQTPSRISIGTAVFAQLTEDYLYFTVHSGPPRLLWKLPIRVGSKPHL